MELKNFDVSLKENKVVITFEQRQHAVQFVKYLMDMTK